MYPGISRLLLLIALTALSACSDNNTETTTEGETPTAMKQDKVASGDGPLAMESGMIEYRLEGIQTGKITKYWRKHGLEVAEYHDTSMNMMGMVQTEKKWLIVKPDGIYNIDQAANSASRMDNPGTAMTSGMSSNQLQEYGREMLEKMGERGGTKEIAGKTCEVWVMAAMNSEVCMWEGLDLYTSTDMAGMGMTRTAVKIEAGKVDSSHFTLPANIQVRELGNPLDWQKQMQQTGESIVE